MPNVHTQDGRSLERLRHHYLIERQLADHLRNSTKDDRTKLYQSVYDELFRRGPDHPQLTRRADAAAQAAAIANHVRLLGRFLKPTSVFMEVGAGDCSLSLEIARRVSRVYAVDVSTEITREVKGSPNVSVLISDGSSIPVPSCSVDVAFSHQLIEHMHVDDAVDHVRNVGNALKAGGIYVCITPHAMSGPHDISKHFDSVARGFHMKEYVNRELIALFRAAGFSRTAPLVGLKGSFFAVSTSAICTLETVLAVLPHSLRQPLARTAPLRQLLGIVIVAQK